MPITCTQCGAQNEEGNFCFQCGGRIGAAPQQPQQPFAGVQPPQTPFPGAQQPQTPFPGAQQPQTPFPGAQQPQTPFPGAQQPQTPFPGAQQPQAPFPGAQQPQQPFPGGYPQQPFQGGYQQAPRKSGGGGKVLVGILGVVVLVAGALYAKSAFSPDPERLPDPPPNNQGAQTNSGTNQGTNQGTQTNQGSQSNQGANANQGGQTNPPTSAALKVTQVSTGSFIGGQAALYDANGSYMVSAKDSQATLYRWHKDGTYEQLATVIDTAAGPVRHVSVGDLLNNESQVAMVSYDNVLYVLRTDGTTSQLEQKTSKVLIGDFTGDGRREALFVIPQSSGKDLLQLIEFGGTEPKELAKLTTDPIPTNLFHGHVRSNGIDLLSSYRRDGNDLVFTLYQFDLATGLVPVVEYPVADPVDNPATWYGTGTIYDGGAGMAITRTGAKPTVDLYALNVDSADHLGSFNLPGGQDHAVLLGLFEGEEPRVMSIDEQGTFFIYKVSE